MIVTTKELFKAAYGKYAIGAYNINNLEQTMGLFRGNLTVLSTIPFRTASRTSLRLSGMSQCPGSKRCAPMSRTGPP